jgi:phosphoglycolate phosphatase
MADFSQIKAIAFDLDGTLIDSVPDLAAATSAALQELNLPLCTQDQVRSWVGNGAEMLMRRALSFALNTAVSDERLAA